MGRVLPVTKSFKSHIVRKPIKVEAVDWLECPVCGGQRIDNFCPTCADYHAPQKCTGEGCKLCKEIEVIRKEKDEKKSLLSPTT